MKRYLSKVRQCTKGFTTAKFHQIPKEENTEANGLAKAASIDQLVDDEIKVQYIRSIDVPNVQQIDGEANWTNQFVSYLKDELLPQDKEEVRKLRVRAAKFVLMDEVLYKRGFSQPYLKCLTPNELHYVMRDVHEGVCENHSGTGFLIHKIVYVGYYWSSM